MGLGMSSRAGLPHFRGKRGDPSERPPRRHETTFLLGLVAFAVVTATWTSLLPSAALPGVRRGEFRPAIARAEDPAIGSARDALGSTLRGSAGSLPRLSLDGSRRLVLASHGRLMWFDVDTKATEVIHEGRGVYYGVFPASESSPGASPESVWVVSRPHNWRPKSTKEALLKIDLRSGALTDEVQIPSHFTHDAVRVRDRVYVADTGGGAVRELAFPSMRPTGRSAPVTVKEHVNTLAPVVASDGAPTGRVWALLHNLGESKLALLDMNSGERVREIKRVGNKAHGLVPWDGGFLILNSGEGQLCHFVPPGEDEGPNARGDLQVLWEDTQKTFMKGLTVVDGVAYFGIAEFGGRAERDSSEKTAEVAAFDLARGAFLWRETVRTNGLLNIVAAPHVAEHSTYLPVAAWRAAALGDAAARAGGEIREEALHNSPREHHRAGRRAGRHRDERGAANPRASNKLAPSGVRWIDLPQKALGEVADADDLLIQHGSVDVSALRAALRATPEFCRAASQGDNARLGGRKGNMDQFKPGVDSAILIFSDYTGRLVFKFPYFDKYADLLRPVLDTVMRDRFGYSASGVSGDSEGYMSHVIRLQLACMNPHSKILKHTDRGGWVQDGHRIHVPIVVPPGEKTQFVMLHRDLGEVDVPLEEGRVFEINNGVPHRVDNDAESWRIHLLLDFVEEPVPSERRFQLKPGQECGYHELHTCDADPWAR